MYTESYINQITNEVIHGAQSILGDKLRKIILYGSYARGDYTNESDVDIMVLADIIEDEKPVFQKAINKIASHVSLENDITVSIFIKDMHFFYAHSDLLPFYRNVITEGIEVYAA